MQRLRILVRRQGRTRYVRLRAGLGAAAAAILLALPVLAGPVRAQVVPNFPGVPPPVPSPVAPPPPGVAIPVQPPQPRPLDSFGDRVTRCNHAYVPPPAQRGGAPVDRDTFVRNCAN